MTFEPLFHDLGGRLDFGGCSWLETNSISIGNGVVHHLDDVVFYLNCYFFFLLLIKKGDASFLSDAALLNIELQFFGHFRI